MTWEEYKKKRQNGTTEKQESSWEQYKQKRQDSIARNKVKQQTSTNNKMSLWQNIQKIAGNTGRTIDNLRLGASRDIKQALNFSFITVDSKNKTEQQIKEQRVLGSKELSDTEKAMYISQQKSKNMPPVATEMQYNLILPTKDVVYNQEKVNEIANSTKLEKAIQKDQEKIQENIEKQTDGVSRKLAELAPSIGSMAVGSVASAIAPSLGTTYFTTSAGGNYMQDALDRGMSKQEAIKYGKIMGLMEGATEAISVGTLSKAGKGLKALIKGSGKEIIKEGTEEIAKNSLKTVLKDYGIGIAENAIQEAIIEPIQEVVAGQIGGQDKANWNDIGQRMLQSGIDGGLTSAILGGANLGIESCIGVVEKTQNGRNVTEQELKNAVQDASKQLDVEKMVTDSVQQQVTKYKTISGDSQSTQNAQNTPSQQIVPMQQENAQNTNIKQILSIKNNSIQTYEESAKKYNIDTNNETVKSIDRITRLRGINASYNADLFSSNDANAIWRTHKDNNGNITREVILNPNADTKKALQNIIVHELTHDFEGTTEYKELKDLILSYDAGNVGFEKARESLGEIYSKVYDRNSIEFQSLIDNEAVADILGNKLGTQEFIDTLTMQKPTTARKIYNWIIDKLNKLNKLTGYTNEKLFWQDVKNKFENAYRQDYKGSDIATKFDIITKGNKQYVKATRQVISGNDPLIWEQQVENYINETIRNGQDVQVLAYDGDILSITKDTAGKAKFRNEVIDKNGNKRRLNNKEFMAKLRAETHIDELAETSKHKQGPIPDTKNHSFAKDGFTYRTAYFEDIDGTYYRITMSVGKNGSINTIYNIGKMQNWQKNRRHSISELKGSSGKTTSDRISSTNSITSLSENVNTTKYSMQESENNSGSFNLPKLKEGYTRLYRGLENEYDANYDKSKLDNSNGYESWTDDYELAKAYGDNVYYVDVPTSEVKNSIIDEDSQSETYGDRNLLYKNDKPVGIKGKSGNEYMLYTDHDNYSNLKYNKVDNNNSVKDNQGRALSKEQQEYFKDSKVRDENGNLLTMYHGTPNGDYTVFKDGTYFSPRKEYADGYQNTWASAISTKQNANNPKTYEVYLNITNPFTLQNPKAKSIYLNEFIKGGNSLSYDPYTDWTNDINNLDEIDWTEAEDLREWLVENHPEYDGLILDEGGDGGYGEAEYRWRGKSFVPFNSNQIKNVDNTNPTTNPDIRYSLPTKEWQQYLDENYKPTGTRTNLADIRLPVKENSQKSSFSMPTKQNTIKLPQKETNVDKYNRYKQNILKGRAEEVNNLIKNKNETINAIEQQIKEKKQLLNNKKDKTTKVANNLKMQIENLEQRKSKIENEYNSRIDRKFDKVTKDKINLATKKELGTTRKEIQQNLLEDTGILNESLDNAQNISMVNMNRTDPIRLQEKVFGKELGTKINDMFFNKIKHNTAEKTRFLNSERNDIKNWGIKARSFESEVLQKYTEKTYVTEEGKEIPYTEADLIKDVPNEEIRNKIKKASEELRKKYDNYIETANDVLIGLGYDAIPKRKDYVRHFTELNDIFTKFGIPGKLDNALPTDINGITDTFRPGKNFFANAQKRHGNKTTYDAITGIDGYIDGISNLIYHTEDIQRLRALDKYIRENYGEKGFENLDNLSEEDKRIRMGKISENHLSNYVAWLTEYTNNLAGKKAMGDRGMENWMGRNIYSTLNAIKKQVGSNMTGFNIGSALTNFISVAQGASKTKKLALLKGTASTIQNIFNNDGFVDRSDFLTNRFGSDRISNTLWQKASNAGQVFMSATDYFSANLIVRSKYYENLAKGMSETEALKNADDFGARILGDRSQGATATFFNSKILGIVTQFQLEVNNQFDTMIHDTIQDFKTTANERGSLKASMGAVWTLGQMAVYQYAFNEIFEAIAGRRPAFDIIDIIKTALGMDDDNEEDSVQDNIQQAAVKLIEGLPFANLLSEDARIPIASAIPNPINIATGESTLKDEVSKLVYLLPPTGGSQAKKSIDGIKTVIDGGSYVTNSEGEKELRFPVENTSALDYIKAGTLGKYSLPLAQEYVDRDYKRLSAKQTKTYEESKVPFKEYLEYIEAGLKTNEDKINYLESKEMNTEQKWGIYTNDLFSSTERKEDGGSQLSDAKYITSNGVSKSEYIKIYNKAQKNNIDMPTAKEYKEMKANNVTLKNYIEYKVKVKEVTESKRKSKELSDTENLKNVDKIQILLNSNYSDKEISGIYANYIKSEKDTEYNIMKATGIDIKEYLKYKQQEFTSDKDDDGTLAGKTVSKSKQKKVVEYLNSNIKKGNQRLLLYAMQGYSMTASQKTQLVNYVKGLKIDNNTKLKLYDKFSGFTVYKDGTIKY